MGTDFTVSHAAALCAQLGRHSRVSVAENPANAWSETDYILALMEFDLQCIALRGTKAKPRMMRTPADDARAKRMMDNSPGPDVVAEKLGIPDERR